MRMVVKRSEMVCCVNLIFLILVRNEDGVVSSPVREKNRPQDVLERSDSLDFVPRMNNGRRSSLRSHEYNVYEFRRRWHRLHLTKVVDRHLLFSRAVTSTWTVKLENASGVWARRRSGGALETSSVRRLFNYSVLSTICNTVVNSSNQVLVNILLTGAFIDTIYNCIE